ncbi:MAG: pyridoxamine 5'-phosphate oxidase family protein [Cyanobacteria bacterium P01_H01_bin.121]
MQHSSTQTSTQASDTFSPTARSRVRRVPKRANYDRDLIYSIVDEGYVCHIAFVVEAQPYVIPTAYGRLDDHIYIHGSPLSRMMRTLSQGVDVCLTVTLLDGLVLARSAFHHSMNYRSVVIFGTATLVQDLEQKQVALRAFSEQLVPGRWADARPPTTAELAATTVLALPLTEASAKVRSGPPKDDHADYALPIWAGEIPLEQAAQAPVRDPQLPTRVALPDYLKHYLNMD